MEIQNYTKRLRVNILSILIILLNLKRTKLF